MKYSAILAAGVVVIIAAAGHVFTARSQGEASQRATEMVAPVTSPGDARKPVAGQVAPARIVSIAPPAVLQKASVETRRAPVPLLLKPRPVVEAAFANELETVPEEPAEFDDKAAKAAIEADGYRGVQILRKGGDGVWHATGLRGRTAVMLTVNADGAVTAD